VINSKRVLRQAVRLALATAAGSAAAPLVLAQATPSENAAGPAPAVEEVVVTGSRLLQAPNDISISPISSVSAETIEKTGLVRVEDVLNMLPQVAMEQGSGNSISSLGNATVSLRGLGSQRTLVLINGRRMQPGGSGGVVGPGGFSSSADVDQIPAELIERADVLTGGASAVYGADAVAGVVNFVLNTHYQGVKIDAGYSYNNHKNNDQTYLGYLSAFGATIPPSTVNTGQNRTLSVLIGSNFADGKGNATAYATYLNSSPAVGYQFDHAGCTLNGGSTPHSAIACGGSGTSGHGQFLMLGTGAASTVLDNAVDPKTGKFRPFNGSDLYNYGALSYFQRSQERWTAGGFLTYDVNSHVSVYSETMYARNASTAQYGPSGAFAFVHTPVLGCNDPLLTADEVATICTASNLTRNQNLFGLPLDTDPATATFEMWVAKRNTEGGGRLDNYLSDSIREVMGAKGEINDAWTYDVYGQFGITDFSDNEGNFLGDPQIGNALQAVPNPATGGIAGVPTGAAVCAAALSGQDPNCVPYDIWVPGLFQPGAPGSPATAAQQLKYLTVPASNNATSKEYIFDASVTGDLGKYGVKLPTANNGLSMNIGTEYREETFDFRPDYIFSNGFQAGGAPSPPQAGKFHVWEGFTELRLPLINDKPGAYLLSLDGGYRYSSYTEGFNTNTYKIGVEWAPIRDVRLRGGYNRAVRAPSISELFLPQAVGAGGTADPCWGPAPALTAAQCALTGVPTSRYGHLLVNPAAQINTLTGGNTALTPEIADTYTVGLVFQPSFVQNLTVSVDAFSILIRDTITSLPSNTIINNCALTGDANLCSLIHRGAQDQSLWTKTSDFVTATNQNIGKLSTRGVDLLAHYRWDIAPKAGKLDFALSGTYTHDFQTAPIQNGPEFDCKGHWGTTCGAPLPSWRHVFTTDWGTPWWGLDLTLRWRYIGSSSVDRSSTDPQLQAPYYISTGHIPAYSYFDFAITAPLGPNFQARVGMNNVTDKNPPLILNGSLSDCPNTSCNDNTWVGTYDTLGRYIFFNLQATF
jgi:outer membrane receptor protein involved in Fe transport